MTLQLQWDGGDLHFVWMHDLAPTFGNKLEDLNGVAAALGVEASEIKSTMLPIQEVSAGSRFLYVPLSSRAAVDRAKMNAAAMTTEFGKGGLAKQSVFVFSTESSDDGATVYGRKLGLDGREDPATGSAAGPLGSYLVHHGAVSRDQAARILIRQGVRMGRPSWLHVQIGLSGDEIIDVRVGGSSVFVGDGTIMLRHD